MKKTEVQKALDKLDSILNQLHRWNRDEGRRFSASVGIAVNAVEGSVTVLRAALEEEMKMGE